MPPEPPPQPTDAELAILQVLWGHGPCTVQQVLDRLEPRRKVGYTTILKLLQIMTEKGLVQRDAQRRPHVFAGRLTKEQTQGQLVRDLLQRAFEGSAAKLVIRALSDDVQHAELEQIRAFLDDIEREGGER